MASLQVVFKNTFLYSLSSIILRASSIIFFPIFSYYLTKGDYGIQSITQTVLSIVACVSGLEMSRGITRFLYKGNKLASDDYTSSLIGSVFLVSLIVSASVVAFLLLTGPSLLKGILNDIPFFPYMALTLVALPFTAVFDLFKSYLKALHKGKQVFWIDILYFGGNIVFNLFFVVVCEMGVLGIILSTLVVGILFFTYCFMAFFRKTVLKIDKTVLKPLLKYSIPMVPFILLGILMESIDRIFLNSVKGVDFSGIYYIATTFASVFSVVKESLNMAFTPWFFEHFKQDNFDYIRKLTNAIFWGAAIVVVLISIYGYEILSLLSNNESLVDAWEYIPFLSIGLYIVFLGQIFNLPVYNSDTHTKYLFLSNLAGFVVNFLLSWLLVEQLAVYGAMIAKVAGFTFMVIVQYLISIKASFFRFDLRVVGLTLLGVSLSFIHFLPVDYVSRLIIKLFVSIGMLSLFSVYIQRQFKGIDMVVKILKGLFYK